MPFVRIELRAGKNSEYRKALGDLVFVEITMSAGRKPPQKRRLFKRLAELLAESPGLKPQELVINLVETAWENWSFGNGEAQYVDSQFCSAPLSL
ncbi:MAG TPA: tautomerase family protein [Candidatus Eisenbacteria bacterium]|nr:tautomerase family protein [Candidatus Eisenbacteria bacterium]